MQICPSRQNLLVLALHFTLVTAQHKTLASAQQKRLAVAHCLFGTKCLRQMKNSPNPFRVRRFFSKADVVSSAPMSSAAFTVSA
jgi:hypothetical protein